PRRAPLFPYTTLFRSGPPTLATALVGTGFSCAPERRVRQSEVVTRIIGSVRDVRRMGSAAIDLCWVACGRLDAYFERGLQPWDRSEEHTSELQSLAYL